VLPYWREGGVHHEYGRVVGFGEEAGAKRQRLMAMFAENPFASPIATALLGAWVLPEEACSDDAWNALVTA
jgi:hypothetical protein